MKCCLYSLAAFLTLNLNAMEQTFRKPVGPINTLCYSPQGEKLARDNGVTVEIWDFNDEKYHSFPVNDIVGSMIFCTLDNKMRLISIPIIAFPPSTSCDLRVWDLENKELIEIFENYYQESSLDACSPDGIFCLHTDSQIQHPTMWEIKTKRIKQQFMNEENDIIYSLVFEKDTQSCAFGTDKGIKIFDVLSGKKTVTFQDDSTSHNGVSFCANSNTIASASGTSIKLWDINSGKIAHEVPLEKLLVTLACSPDDVTIAYSIENTNQIFFLDTRK